jgi:hypothetical protein
MYTPGLEYLFPGARGQNTDEPASTKSLCFQEAAEALRKKQITTEEYFRINLAHVVLHGIRHESDESDMFLTSLVTTDPVAGAFKMWMLDSNFKAVDEKG